MTDQTDNAARNAEALAQRFHETYERLAPSFGYETREASAKPWADVPDQNKRLMIAVCAELLAADMVEAWVGEATDDEIYRAAVLWCGRKERETFQEDITYFKCNWRSLPGLKAVVDEVRLAALAPPASGEVEPASGVTEVTQVDVDAAEAWLNRDRPIENVAAALAEAFSRHRQTARNDTLREAAEVIEKMQKVDWWYGRSNMASSLNRVLIEGANAIRILALATKGGTGA